MHATAPTDDLLEALLDLKHDLGKHLLLPLALLPRSADARTVRQAALQALTRTRRGRCGDCSARQLWARFLSETENARGPWNHNPAFEALDRAVQCALSWEERLATQDSGSASVCCPRTTITDDFRRVSETIAALIDALQQPALPATPHPDRRGHDPEDCAVDSER